jgi:hypothetical protein
LKQEISTYAFVKELSDFSFELSVLDRVWNIIFPDRRLKWHHLHVNKYKNTFFITLVDGDGGGASFGLRGRADVAVCGQAAQGEGMDAHRGLVLDGLRLYRKKTAII